MTILCGQGSDKNRLVDAIPVGARLAREDGVSFGIEAA
jgi:hypothetical protein